MLDAGMDTIELHREGPVRLAFAALFCAMLEAGYDRDTVVLILASPAAFLNVEFVPEGVH